MDEDVSADWSSKYLTKVGIEKLVEDHNLVDVKMYMEFNHLDKKFKCYGHLGIPQHNWVTVKIGICVMFAHCMLFFEIPEGKVIELPIYKVDQPGNYVLVHFIEYNLYEEPPEDLKLYGVRQTMGFHQDKDSSLICGQSKHTPEIDHELEDGVAPMPSMCMILVSSIQSPTTGIEDPGAFFPHSWLFVQPHSKWEECVVDCMSHDVHEDDYYLLAKATKEYSSHVTMADIHIITIYSK